jgi:hypothetical protein
LGSSPLLLSRLNPEASSYDETNFFFISKWVRQFHNTNIIYELQLLKILFLKLTNLFQNLRQFHFLYKQFYSKLRSGWFFARKPYNEVIR